MGREGCSTSRPGDSTMQEDYLEFVKQLLNVREGDKVNGPTTLLFASTGLTTT